MNGAWSPPEPPSELDFQTLHLLPLALSAMFLGPCSAYQGPCSAYQLGTPDANAGHGGVEEERAAVELLHHRHLLELGRPTD